MNEKNQQSAQLKKSEELFRLMAENGRDMIYRMRISDAVYEYVSPASIEIFGYTPEEFYNTPLLIEKVIHPDWTEYFKTEWQNLIDGNVPPFYEFQIIDKSGEVKWLNQRNTLVKDDNGKPIAIEGAVTDVTVRKQAEQTMLAEKLFSESLITNLPGVFYLISEDYKFLRWNKKFEAVTGRSPEEMTRISPMDLFEGDDKQAIAEAIQKVFTHGQVEVRGTFVAKNGKKTPYQFTGDKIIVDGKPCLIGVGLDITKQQKAEKALAHSHDLMQYIIEHNRSAVAVHDMDLNYIYVSQRYLDDYNVQEKDIIGKHHYDVFPDLPQKWRDVHQLVLKGEVISAEDDTYEREDGSMEWTRWECRPWYESDGSIGGIIVYTEVITKQKEIEDALIKAKERAVESEILKNKLVANIGDVIVIIDHEGNNRYKSPNVEKLFGWKPEELIGHNAFDNVHPDDIEKANIFIDSLLSEPDKTGSEEVRYRHKNGSYVWIRFTGSNLLHDPIINGILGNYHDISDSKNTEKELEKHKNNLEEIVKERTKELEEKNEELANFNQLFVGREFRIKELKDKIKELEEKLK